MDLCDADTNQRTGITNNFQNFFHQNHTLAWAQPVSRCQFYLSYSIEFSLKDFLWIQRIQWIMTKSKSSMVTRDILYLTIDTFLDIVV